MGVIAVPHEIDSYHPTALVVKKSNSEIKEEDIVSYVAGSYFDSYSKTVKKRVSQNIKLCFRKFE